MIDWNSIIWFVIWAAVILVSLGLIIWASLALFAARQFKSVKSDFKADFDKGFDSDFFKSSRTITRK